METAYAQALWQSVQRGMAPKKAVESMQEVLRAHGREALIPRIAKAFARIAEREARRSAVVFTVARTGDERAAMRAAKEPLLRTGAGAGDVVVETDDSLVGGWRLEGREHLHDASWKKQLLDMYAKITTD